MAGRRTTATIRRVTRNDYTDPSVFPTEIEGVRVFTRPTSGVEFSNGGDDCNAGYCHDEDWSLPITMGNAGADDQLCIAGTVGFKACAGTGTVKADTFATVQHALANDNLCQGVPYGTNRFLHPMCTFGEIVGVLRDTADDAVCESCSGKIQFDTAIFSTNIF